MMEQQGLDLSSHDKINEKQYNQNHMKQYFSSYWISGNKNRGPQERNDVR